MSFFDNLRSKLNPSTTNPDERLRSLLLNQGDDGTKIRPVEHLASFNTDIDAGNYAAFVVSRGYALGEAEEEHAVAFSRDSTIVGEAFDEELNVLRKKADELDGQYEGWGCSVVPST